PCAPPISESQGHRSPPAEQRPHGRSWWPVRAPPGLPVAGTGDARSAHRTGRAADGGRRAARGARPPAEDAGRSAEAVPDPRIRPPVEPGSVAAGGSGGALSVRARSRQYVLWRDQRYGIAEGVEDRFDDGKRVWSGGSAGITHGTAGTRPARAPARRGDARRRGNDRLRGGGARPVEAARSIDVVGLRR